MAGDSIGLDDNSNTGSFCECLEHKLRDNVICPRHRRCMCTIP